ncbi:probable cytochrome P450 4d14 [Sabethes cyaneus]|uniref:probable cytochrome P450 4d14 n=1 Tax=Sabethes cyaneus TaxID=53552 RepID=UPI00237DA56C|nr:probable cytochrome P450 4d14 [Sabethes cyaneus]
MFAFTLLTVVVVIFAYLWQWRSRLKAPFRSVPGPATLPLVGNAPEIVRKTSTELFHWLLELETRYGQLYQIDGISQIWLVCASPKHVEKIMTGAEFNCKGEDYDVLLEWLGTGLLTSSGNKWFTHRKALTSAFHFKILENFVPVFDRQSTVLMEKLRKTDGKVVKIFPMVKLCTLDIIVETAMGTPSSAQITQSSYTLAVEEMATIAFLRMFNRFYFSDFIFRFSKFYPTYGRCLKTIQNFTLSIIEKRRKTLQQNAAEDGQQPPQGNDDLGSKPKMALLDILLQTNIDGRPLTDEEIREEVDTFMFAGHDTTASAITFLLYTLAKHPDVQQKVYEEIIAVLGDSSSSGETPLNISTLNDLKYLDLVIKESLRLFPPVPFITRTALKEVDLCGLKVPADTNFTIGIYNMHHNAAYFPDPERFIPERFEAERGAEKLNPYAYVPFSAGGRNCIGQKFAQYEIKSTISKVIRNCRVELPYPDYEAPLKAEMILKPLDDMPLKFHSR